VTLFDWAAAGLVIVTLIYVSFVLTLRDWLLALARGEAVKLLPERGDRKWPLWTQIGIVLLGVALCVPFFYFLWLPLLPDLASVGSALKSIGLLIYLLGLAFVLWARSTLGRNWGLSTSMQVSLLKDHNLIQSGPYRLVRHPMYLGWWVCMLGLTVLYPVWAVLLLFIFSVVSFSNRAHREESALSMRFGQAWADYRRRTRFLIPFIY
jgi:protein-S-isoprenylcysteine O-methyltransferase Ste14